eukprot:scaffold34609_cov146-Amphora_coffeaeformis.AAC.18
MSATAQCKIEAHRAPLNISTRGTIETESVEKNNNSTYPRRIFLVVCQPAFSSSRWYGSMRLRRLKTTGRSCKINKYTFFLVLSWFLWPAVLVVASAKKSNDVYDRIGVPKTCSQNELTKAYRKACLKHHPDKEGNEEDFKGKNMSCTKLWGGGSRSGRLKWWRLWRIAPILVQLGAFSTRKISFVDFHRISNPMDSATGEGSINLGATSKRSSVQSPPRISNNQDCLSRWGGLGVKTS